jgi:hypothetical protein
LADPGIPELDYRYVRRNSSQGAGAKRTRWRGLANAVMSAPRGSTDRDGSKVRVLLTKDILFGMNVLTLAGFVVMGLIITLTLNRMGQTGKAL